ncbi:ArnT family glycosyltransferase [Micromonospora echinofusca]|uniref:Glycosyl transferase n=1 Tax=Micromonospora echinofusca TaxID=47858 RepID=A0ABS3VQ71_MICEH|nr:glycosyltransferase family 39 protein [Micromonospora echinofusca]MBO4206646.1 glycosyl transferase [Micromonospora echinofusca]
MERTETLPDHGTAPPAVAGPTDVPAPADPRWARPALVVLLAATAVLYLWGLSASGWANAFYSAAAQAGSVSGKAFFYGSSDAANSITVDKPPASLWLMALSVRIFGLNSWAILVPQALCGVASVGVLHAAVRRWYGPAAGLTAGAVLAVTPVATLMFRFNNPDALLVLLLVLGAYATVRAVERASTRWLVLVGVLVGFAFLTKMLQAFLVVPVFAGVYLLAAPTGFRRRTGQLLLAGLGVLVAAGWWVTIVELVPADARPYIGGSQNNSVLELTLGYNGLGRITGAQEGSVGGGPGGAGGGRWGRTGWSRLFDSEIGGQVSWLLPAALILLVAGLLLAGRAARTDRTRAGLLLWGGWLLATGATFSFMAGIFHAYYTVALAPAVGALVGIGATLLWRRRHLLASVVLGATLAVTALWSWQLLRRSPDWYPWLRTTVLVAGLVVALLVVLRTRLPGRVLPAVLLSGAAVALAGPVAYSVQTASTPHTGSIPTAGPAVAGGFGPGGRAFPGGFPGDGLPGGGPDDGFPGGGPDDDGRGDGGNRLILPGGGRPPGNGQPPTGGTRAGGMGGLLDATTPGTELRELFGQDSDRYTWIAATVGSNNASGYQLATGEPVMAVGGFNGSDPSPTLDQFKRYVADGRIHYFIGGGGFRADGGSQAAQEIATWVSGTFPATPVDGVTLYDLSGGAEG